MRRKEETMTNTLKVFIADDSFLVRERLLGMLSNFEELEVVGQAENAAAAMDEIQRLQPDAVVLDIHMPSPDQAGLVQSGFDVLERIKSESPATFVTILSNYYYSQYRDKCVAALRRFYRTLWFCAETHRLRQLRICRGIANSSSC